MKVWDQLSHLFVLPILDGRLDPLVDPRLVGHDRVVSDDDLAPGGPMLFRDEFSDRGDPSRQRLEPGIDEMKEIGRLPGAGA